MNNEEVYSEYEAEMEKDAGFMPLDKMSYDELMETALAYVKSSTHYQLTQILALCREMFFEWEI